MQIHAAYFLLCTTYIAQHLLVHQNTFFAGLPPHPQSNQEFLGPLLWDPLFKRKITWNRSFA